MLRRGGWWLWWGTLLQERPSEGTEVTEGTGREWPIANSRPKREKGRTRTGTDGPPAVAFPPVLNGRVESKFPLGGADPLAPRMIKVQSGDRRPAYWSQSLNPEAIQPEVIRPGLLDWIEQRN